MCIRDRNLKGKITFSGQDITDLIRFLDPNADGDVSATELQAGLDLAKAPPPQQSFCDDSFVLMNKFEASMKKKAQTVVRLFHEIDADRSGKLDIRELGVALDALAGPSARARRVYVDASASPGGSVSQNFCNTTSPPGGRDGALRRVSRSPRVLCETEREAGHGGVRGGARGAARGVGPERVEWRRRRVGGGLGRRAGAPLQQVRELRHGREPTPGVRHEDAEGRVP